MASGESSGEVLQLLSVLSFLAIIMGSDLRIQVFSSQEEKKIIKGSIFIIKSSSSSPVPYLHTADGEG